MTLELSPEEWEGVYRDYKKEARNVCIDCRSVIDEEMVITEMSCPGDHDTPPSYDNLCPDCGGSLETDLETFDEWLNRTN